MCPSSHRGRDGEAVFVNGDGVLHRRVGRNMPVSSAVRKVDGVDSGVATEVVVRDAVQEVISVADGCGAVSRSWKCVAPQEVQRLDLFPNWYCGRPRAPACLRRLLHEIELEAVLRETYEPVASRVAVVATEAQRSRATYGHAVVTEGL